MSKREKDIVNAVPEWRFAFNDNYKRKLLGLENLANKYIILYFDDLYGYISGIQIDNNFFGKTNSNFKMLKVNPDGTLFLHGMGLTIADYGDKGYEGGSMRYLHINNNDNLISYNNSQGQGIWKLNFHKAKRVKITEIAYMPDDEINEFIGLGFESVSDGIENYFDIVIDDVSSCQTAVNFAGKSLTFYKSSWQNGISTIKIDSKIIGNKNHGSEIGTVMMNEEGELTLNSLTADYEEGTEYAANYFINFLSITNNHNETIDINAGDALKDELLWNQKVKLEIIYYDDASIRGFRFKML